MLVTVLFMMFFYPPERQAYFLPGVIVLLFWMLFIRFYLFGKLEKSQKLDWLSIGILAPSWVLTYVAVFIAPMEIGFMEFVVLLTLIAGLMFFSDIYFAAFTLLSIGSYIACCLTSKRPFDVMNWLQLLVILPCLATAIRLTIKKCFSELVAKELERKELIERLKNNQDQLTAILNQAPLILCVINRDGHYLHSRGSGLSALNLQQNEIVGTHYSKVFEKFPTICEAVSKAMNGTPAQVRVEFGQGVYYEIRYGGVYGPGGDLAEVIGVGLDVSQSVRADEREKQYLKKLYHSQKVESLETLAGGVAHDFNNYLMAIVGFCESLDTSSQSSSRDQETIGLIRDTALQAAGVSNQMLVYAGKDDRALHENFKELELTQFLEGIHSLLDAIVEKNTTVTIRENSAPAKYWIRADHGLLQQALINIVKNSNDAFEGKAGSIEIFAGPIELPLPSNSKVFGELSPDTQYCQITTIDSGTGIADVDLERIFDIYFTTKTTGHGIGLAVTASIMKNHGGAIVYESRFGEGTVSRLVLPLMASPGTTTKRLSKTKIRNKLVGRKVAIIDDEKLVNDAIKTMLEAQQCEVIQFESGKSAIDKLASLEDCDCLIIDYSMPGLNGLETLQELRRLDITIPVILVSGFSFEFQDSERFEFWPDENLSKPFTLQTLTDSVFRTVSKERQAQTFFE